VGGKVGKHTFQGMRCAIGGRIRSKDTKTFNASRRYGGGSFKKQGGISERNGKIRHRKKKNGMGEGMSRRKIMGGE